MRARSDFFRPVLLLTLAAACGGGGGGGGGGPTQPPPPPPTTASVVLSQSAATLVPTETVTLTATARDGAGNVLQRTFTWSTSDQTKATVAEGLVTGVAAGAATITASVDGRSAQATITVKDGAFLGPAGGQIEGLGGVVRLTIPAGALAASTRITVEPAPAPLASPRLVPQTAVEFGPAGLAFAQPAALRLRYAPAQLPAGPPERLLGLHRAAAGTWGAPLVSVLDLAEKTLTTELAGFSTYGILTAPFVDHVTLSTTEAVLAVGQELQLEATPRDAGGAGLEDRDVSWISDKPAVASVGLATGLVTAVSDGKATITATIEGKSATAEITVAIEGAVIIASIAPATLTPGAAGTITGQNFGAVESHTLTVGGVAAVITSSTPTEIGFTLPAAGFACQPTQPVPVVLTRTGSPPAEVQHPLATAPARVLAPGEAAYLLTAAEVDCAELPADGGSYLVSVINTTAAPTQSAGFELTGAVAGPPGTARPVSLVPGRDPLGPPPGQSAEWAHAALLEKNLAVLRSHPSPLRALAQARLTGARVGPAAVPTEVGATSEVRLPNINSGNHCQNFQTLTVRTVYAGTRVIVVEDVAAPLAQTMDASYTALGELYDNVMHGVITANAGNPLALDPLLDHDGRLVMVFSPAVNAFGTVAGFVASCDFFPQATFASSNVGEFFYAIVPTTNNNSGTQFDLSFWFWSIRSTVIHEVKHITSFAERISRAGMGQPNYEESWLEEGSARLIEELWARTYQGNGWKGNTTYQGSVFCDVRRTSGQCSTWAYTMYKHWSTLHQYYKAQATSSVLGPVANGDFSFYASVWALLRWAMDAYALSEGAFLTALVQDVTVKGMANLEARTGESFPRLFARWTLAMWVDDRMGVVTADPRLDFPSWNTPNLFAGLNTDFPAMFSPASPMAAVEVVFGNFLAAAALNGGTSAWVRISGVQAVPQLLRLRGAGGGALPAGIRMAILRLN